MSTLTEIGDFLEAHGLGSQSGPQPTICLGVRPDMPDTLLSLHTYLGGTPEYVQDSAFPSAERPSVQVIARAARYDDAEALINRAWAALCVVTNARLSGTYYRSIKPNSSPGVLGRDSHERTLMYFNLSVEKEVSSGTIS